MAKKKELSEDLRMCIVNSRKDEKGYKVISKQFRVPVATIQSIIRKYKEFHTVRNLGGRGRKPKLSPRLARKVCERPTTIHGSPSRVSWTTLASLGPRYQGRHSSEHCTREVSMDADRERRHSWDRGIGKLVWHLQERTWTKIQAFGHRFCGQNETKMELFGHRDVAFVWRKKGEAYNPKNTVPIVKHGGGTSCCGDVSQPVGPGISSK